MILSTSAVAVCCWSDSLKSSVRRLHFLEQPHVPDSDHRLIGKGLQQVNLFVAEGVHFGAAKDDGADAFALAH